MKIVKKEPKPGDIVLCGKYPMLSYVARCVRSRDGYCLTDNPEKYTDLKDVWVLEYENNIR